MQEIIMLSIYGILTAIIILSVFAIRRERKMILKAEKVIADDVKTASDVLDKFYGKLNEFMEGITEISDKANTESETRNP